MRWKPSPAQIALAIDCAVAKVPLERAALLIGVSPRTVRAFLNRLEKARAQEAISGVAVEPGLARPNGEGPRYEHY